MGDCVLFGFLAAMNNYVTKDGKTGCNISVSSASGVLYSFIARDQLPVLDFGTPVTVQFDISFFNGRPGSLIAKNVSKSKTKGE